MRKAHTQLLFLKFSFYYPAPEISLQPTDLSRENTIGKPFYVALFLDTSRRFLKTIHSHAISNSTNTIIQNLFFTVKNFTLIYFPEFPGKTQSVPIQLSAPTLLPLSLYFFLTNQPQTFRKCLHTHNKIRRTTIPQEKCSKPN